MIVYLIFVYLSFSIIQADSIHIAKKGAASEILQQQTATKKIKIDCIKSLVHGPERTVPICMSDERRHGIDGLSVTFNELCTKELVYQDALKNKFPIDDAVVKDNLRKTISLFGLKPGDEEHIFAQEGYSYDEGFEQFRILYTNDTMMNYRVGSISVTEQEVLDYYNAHPKVKEPKYCIQTSFIKRLEGEQQKDFDHRVQLLLQDQESNIIWSDPSWILKSELAEGIDFITTMERGTISKHVVKNDVLLYKLVNKKPERLVSLQKRRKKIAELLRRPKFEAQVQKYKKSLFDQATIVYL